MSMHLLKSIFVLLLSFTLLHSDNPPGPSFFSRVKVYSKGKCEKMYLPQEMDRLEKYREEIEKNYKWDFYTNNLNIGMNDPQGEINVQSCKYLFINRIETGFDRQKEIGVKLKDNEFVYVDSLYTYKNGDTVLFRYAIPKKRTFSNIDLIEVEEILWHAIGYQEQWVNKKFAKILQTKKMVFHKKWVYEGADARLEINTISLDPKWTEKRFNTYYDTTNFNSVVYGTGIHTVLHPEIKKAIRQKKLFVFTHATP